MGKTYWMLVTTQENLDITRARGFSMQGVDTKNRKKAATATVTSDSFEDDERIWKHHREKETFPHRVELNADVVLEQSNYIDGYQVGPTLEYVKKWPPHLWPHAFFGMLHIIPQRDFNYIEGELRRANGEAPTPPPVEAVEPATIEFIAEASTTASTEDISTGWAYSPKSKFPVGRKSRKSSHRRRTQKRR